MNKIDTKEELRKKAEKLEDKLNLTTAQERIEIIRAELEAKKFNEDFPLPEHHIIKQQLWNDQDGCCAICNEERGFNDMHLSEERDVLICNQCSKPLPL